MTRTGKRLIQDFVIPALETQKYGELLQWVDRTQRIFEIKWSHKNAARWSSGDTNVFQDWDRLKGHFHPERPGYYMQAKQRFRAALQKLKNYVRRLDFDEKGFKRYKLLNPEKKPPKSDKDKEKKKHNVRKIVRAIPTSVICQNTSYNRNVASTSSSSSTSSYFPSSPSSSSQESNQSVSSTSSYDLEQLEQSYKSAQERQMRAYGINTSMKEETMSDEEVSDSDQKENLKSQTQQRDPPHVPIESVCNMLPFYENFATPRFESPKILLVRTHYEPRPPRPMGSYNVGCVADPPSALNLSVKQEVK